MSEASSSTPTTTAQKAMIHENPNAALVFYWAALNHQIRITGSVTRVSREESEAYFRTRPTR